MQIPQLNHHQFRIQLITPNAMAETTKTDIIRIIILDDSNDDIFLIERELKKSAIPTEFSSADNREDFEELLEIFKPDVILCDHLMPMFNSIDALEIVRNYRKKRQKRIPFILVTGTVSEEFAVDSMHRGADDYILKDRLTHLPEAILNAIKRSKAEQEKQAYFERVLSEEARMKEVERLANIGIWKTNTTTWETEWSEGIYNILELESAESKPDFDLFMKMVHPDDRLSLFNIIDRIIKTGKKSESEFRIITRSGNIKTIFNRGVPDQSERSGNILIGFAYDISDQTKTRMLLHDAYRLARIGRWELNVRQNEITWSDVTREIHEVGPDFYPNPDNALSFFKEGYNRDIIYRAFEAGINKGIPWDLEAMIITNLGNEKWVRIIGKAEIVDEQCIRLYGSIQDIHITKKALLDIGSQNKMLRQIAWTQSHKVLSPISTLMGLINLLANYKEADRDRDYIISEIQKHASKLEELNRQVVRMTEDIITPDEINYQEGDN